MSIAKGPKYVGFTFLAFSLPIDLTNFSLLVCWLREALESQIPPFCMRLKCFVLWKGLIRGWMEVNITRADCPPDINANFTWHLVILLLSLFTINHAETQWIFPTTTGVWYSNSAKMYPSSLQWLIHSTPKPLPALLLSSSCDDRRGATDSGAQGNFLPAH